MTRVSATAALLSPVRSMSSRVTNEATSEVCSIGSGMYSPRTTTWSSCLGALVVLLVPVVEPASVLVDCASAAPENSKVEMERDRPVRERRATAEVRIVGALATER